MTAELRIGTSGWLYPHWRERFYPPALPAREQLAFYATHFDTVELNNSFYRQPSREQFESWAQRVPDGFLFAVKGSRFVSHIRRLAVGHESVEKVVEPARGLGQKLGPVLFQFPGNWACDLARLKTFLPMLPKTVRFAFEFRHESWLTSPVFDLLRSHAAALCIPDHPKMPQAFPVTADFAYVRMHGGAQSIGYAHSALALWAGHIDEWRARGIAVYVYLNNDLEGYAISNARTLRQMLEREGRDSNPGSGLRARSSA